MTFRWVDPIPSAQGAPITSYTLSLFQTTDAANLAAVDQSASTFYRSTAPLVVTINVQSTGGFLRTFDPSAKVFTNVFVLSSNLRPYNNYAVSVALNTGALLGVATQINARTAQTVPASPPQNVQLFSTYNSVTVTFSPPVSFLRNGIITNYIVQYTRYPQPVMENGGTPAVRNEQVVVMSRNVPVNVDPTSTLSTTLVLNNASEITSWTVFGIQVRAIVAGQQGPFSMLLNVTSQPRAPGLPPVPSVVSVSRSSVTITWPQINTLWGPITRVQVIVEPAASLAYRNCNSTVSCVDNTPNNYETGPDCGGDCSPCTILDLSLPVLNYGNYTSPPVNGLPIAYITYDYVFAPGEWVSRSAM
jgi:hypothetical protein